VGDPLADLGSHSATGLWVALPAAHSQAGSHASSWWNAMRFSKDRPRRIGIAFYEVLGVFKLAVILQQFTTGM